MAGAIQLTEVDFEQIKQNLIDYLKSTKQFTDYDFDGSNLQVILNLIAYQQQLNSYNANMIANESFLASATVRDNVVANARQIGYVPVSRRSAVAYIDLSFTLDANDYPSGFPEFLELRNGGTFSTKTGAENFTFNVIETQTAAVTNVGSCLFSQVPVHEGLYLSDQYIVDLSDYDERYVIRNAGVDTTTIRVEVQEDPNEEITYFYQQANNLVEINEDSRAYWLEEIDNQQYELTFGDGLFGKKLENGAVINVTYVVSSGALANAIQGANNYNYVGNCFDSTGTRVTITPAITNVPVADGGAEIEDSSSIKFRAPKFYGAQKRCVTSDDYDALIRQIYPAVDDIFVFGGEKLAIPEYGRVYVVIKPKSGESLSNSTKNYIISSLDKYRIASLDIKIVDPDILYVEIESVVRYNDTQTLKDSSGIISAVKTTLGNVAESPTVSKFGGSARYSRIVGAIDDSDRSIVRNNSRLRMRRDLKVVQNSQASYELCFENPIDKDCDSYTVWSTGFTLSFDGVADQTTYYLEDDGKGKIKLVYFNNLNEKVTKNDSFGTIDYIRGEIKIGYDNPITFIGTTLGSSVVEVRAYPQSQDVLSTRTIYLDLDISKSDISAIVDRRPNDS